MVEWALELVVLQALDESISYAYVALLLQYHPVLSHIDTTLVDGLNL